MEITHVGFSQVNFKKTPPFIEKKDVIDERGFVSNIDKRGAFENVNIRSVGIRPPFK